MSTNVSGDAPSTGVVGTLRMLADTVLTFGFPLSIPQPTWTLDNMNDQTGKVIFVSGGNSGVGYATAKAYYDRGATVFIGCRSETRALQAIDDMKKGGERTNLGVLEYKPLPTNPGRIEYIHLDLSNLSSVDQCVREFGGREHRLDVLFANAGLMAIPSGQYTPQGVSLQFGTNVLGHQQLITGLAPLLRRTSLADPARPARLVVVASAAHVVSPSPIPYNRLVRSGKPMFTWLEYGASKWGDIALARHAHFLWGPPAASGQGTSRAEAAEGPDADPSPASTELAQRDGGEIISVAVHPGVVNSGLWDHLPFWSIVNLFPWLMYLLGTSPTKGALNQVWAAELPADEARALSGGYVTCYERRGIMRADLFDGAKVEELWDWCTAQARRAA